MATSDPGPSAIVFGKGGSANGGKPGVSGGKSARPLSGGTWITIHGHPLYFKDGQVVHGGAPGVTHNPHDHPTHPLRPLHPPDVDAARLAKSVEHAERAEAARHNEAYHGRWKVERSDVTGPGANPQDHVHLAKAVATGRSAIVVTSHPDVETLTDRQAIRRDLWMDPDAAHPAATYHVVGGDHVASIRPEPMPGKPDRHVTHDSTGDEQAHRSEAGAMNRVKRLVGGAVKDETTAHRLLVPHADSFDAREYAVVGGHHGVTVRVLGRQGDRGGNGKGKDVAMSNDRLGAAKFARGGVAKSAPKAKGADHPTANGTAAGKPTDHATTKPAPAKGATQSRKPGGCGTGAGGFQKGNSCGHGSLRNAHVTAARSAHTHARREAQRHVNEGTILSKEGRAALRNAAGKHKELQAARETHRAEKRERKNAAARDRRVVDKFKMVAPKDAPAIAKADATPLGGKSGDTTPTSPRTIKLKPKSAADRDTTARHERVIRAREAANRARTEGGATDKDHAARRRADDRVKAEVEINDRYRGAKVAGKDEGGATRSTSKPVLAPSPVAAAKSSAARITAKSAANPMHFPGHDTDRDAMNAKYDEHGFPRAEARPDTAKAAATSAPTSTPTPAARPKPVQSKPAHRDLKPRDERADQLAERARLKGQHAMRQKEISEAPGPRIKQLHGRWTRLQEAASAARPEKIETKQKKSQWPSR